MRTTYQIYLIVLFEWFTKVISRLCHISAIDTLLAGVQGSYGLASWSTTDLFSGDKYCNCHLTDGTFKCICCGQLCPKKEQWVTSPGKPALCLSCRRTAVGNTQECTNLYSEAGTPRIPVTTAIYLRVVAHLLCRARWQFEQDY